MAFKRQEITLYGIYRHGSYRLMKVNNQYYITDIERPLVIMQLIPFLEWLLPHKFYPITEEQFNYLQSHFPVGSKTKINVFWLSIDSLFGGGALLYQRLIHHSSLIAILPIILIITGLIIGIIIRCSFIGRTSLDNIFKNKPVLGWLFPVPVENLDPIF